MIKSEKIRYFELLDRINYFSPEVSFNEKSKFSILEVFIYASGKTASTSLFESFKSMKKNCIHMHSSEYYLNNILKLPLYDNFHMMDYINYLAINRTPRILVIDIFREPIARKISAFFQHFDRFNYLDKGFKSFDDMKNYYMNNIDELITIFNDDFLIVRENYYAFDEYKRDDVDIRKLSFSHKKKRIHFKHNNKKYLIIRFDDIKKWNEIFQEIGYEDFNLISANTTESKDIAELNKKFKDNYFIPKIHLDTIYLNKHNEVLKQFYTKDEFNDKYNYWLEKSI